MMAMSSVRARGGTRLVVQQPARCVQSRKSLKIEARSHRAGVGLMGTKAGMTTLYEEATGNAVVVTVIGFESPNYVTQKFTKEEHGYDAVQVRQVRLCVSPTTLTPPLQFHGPSAVLPAALELAGDAHEHQTVTCLAAVEQGCRPGSRTLCLKPAQSFTECIARSRQPSAELHTHALCVLALVRSSVCDRRHHSRQPMYIYLRAIAALQPQSIQCRWATRRFARRT